MLHCRGMAVKFRDRVVTLRNTTVRWREETRGINDPIYSTVNLLVIQFFSQFFFFFFFNL